ncbi:MAG: chromatin binding, partial [Paramarteilia canceri]
ENETPIIPNKDSLTVQKDVINKHLFLECFMDAGKNFDYLASLYNLRNKKISSTFLRKNKDQMKYFYFNNWYKIYNYVKEIESINKIALEVLTYVNYAALYKISQDDSLLGSLNDLIIKGSITLKYKGKNHQVKTPNCKALKNMAYQLVFGGKKVPKTFQLSLIPHTNRAWNYMQSLAFNPRMIFNARPDNNLNEIFQHISSKLAVATQTEINKLHDIIEIFPLPTLDVKDVPEEIDLGSKKDYNYSLFKSIYLAINNIQQDKLTMFTKKHSTNLRWTATDGEKITICRLYKILNRPKKIELFYDIKIEFETSLQEPLSNSFINKDSTTLRKILLTKLVDLAKIRCNAICKPKVFLSFTFSCI